MKTSIQLYSLREEICSYGLRTVLNEIKNAGFDGVELAGYYEQSPEELKKTFDTVNLKVCGAHVGLDEILNHEESILSYADALGYKSIIIPHLTIKDLDERLNDIIKVSEKLTSLGYTLGYHNHDHELIGKDYLKYLIDNVSNLYLETDMFWITAANKDAVTYVDNYGDRLKWIHLKEMGKDMYDFNPIVGLGRVNASAIISKFKDKMEWIILEVEKMDMLYTDYIQKSCNFMKNEIAK